MNAIAPIRQAPALTFEHQMQLAESFAKSGLFGLKSYDQALALMALCEAEGMHPAIAVRDYHIIQGKPALKADAMLARFQAAGGKVKWIDMTDEKVSAEFSHPSGGSVVIDWDKARALTAGFLGKDTWKKFPRAMLRARVVSEGIRTVFPGVVVGVYTPEEIQDFDDKPIVAEVVQSTAGKPVDGVWESIDADRKPELEKIAAIVREYFEGDDLKGALEYLERQNLGVEEKSATWSILPSNMRTALRVAKQTIDAVGAQ